MYVPHVGTCTRDVVTRCTLRYSPAPGYHRDDCGLCWKFAKVDSLGKRAPWQNVRVPHDWAVHEPFAREHDLQIVAVDTALLRDTIVMTAVCFPILEKTGRTGGLPYMGKGIYTTTFEVADTAGQHFTLVFDGAMSNPRVTVNDGARLPRLSTFANFQPVSRVVWVRAASCVAGISSKPPVMAAK